MKKTNYVGNSTEQSLGQPSTARGSRPSTGVCVRDVHSGIVVFVGMVTVGCVKYFFGLFGSWALNTLSVLLKGENKELR